MKRKSIENSERPMDEGRPRPFNQIQITDRPKRSSQTYGEKLKDPRWQKRRLEMLEAADWACDDCRTKSDTLHVHHGYYSRGMDPWEYPSDTLHVLCETCHKKSEVGRDKLYALLARLRPRSLTWLGETLTDTPDARTAERILTALSCVLSTAATVAVWPKSLDSTDVLTWLFEQTHGELLQDARRAGWDAARVVLDDDDEPKATK